MKIPVLMVVAACVVANTSEAQTRNFHTFDGNFTLCENRDISECSLLTDALVAEPRFSADDRRILAAMKRYAQSSHFTTDDLQQSFGDWTLLTRLPGKGESYGISWTLDSSSICPSSIKWYCSLEIVLSDGTISSMKFAGSTFVVNWFQRTPPGPFSH